MPGSSDHDGGFIPRECSCGESAGLAENRCLERRERGCKLLQVGEQDIALGAKFRARVILDIQVRPVFCDRTFGCNDMYRAIAVERVR